MKIYILEQITNSYQFLPRFGDRGGISTEQIGFFDSEEKVKLEFEKFYKNSASIIGFRVEKLDNNKFSVTDEFNRAFPYIISYHEQEVQ